MAPYSFREHTGELKLRLESNTLEGLFVEAAQALAEIVAGNPGSREQQAVGRGTESAGAPRKHTATAEHTATASEVRLEAPDRDALLVDWLNELIYTSERDKCVYDQVSMKSLSEQALVAEIRGRATERLCLPVKAATFHGLRIEHDVSGWHAEVVLDV